MAAETPDTTKFELDGKTYELPDFLDLDLDDWEIIWDECQVSLNDFSEVGDPEQDEKRLRRLNNPRLERAFIMVALKRANPDGDIDQIRKDAGRIKLMPYLLGQAAADAEANPTSASEPERSSRPSSDSTSESSSPPSPESSDEPDGQPVPTGISG